METKKTPTKEELIATNAQLLARANELEASDHTRRLELSRALGAGTYKKDYETKSYHYVWDWAEINVELGKRLAGIDYTKVQKDLDDLNKLVKELKQKEWEREHPNQN